jgi:hypothetical protein
MENPVNNPLLATEPGDVVGELESLRHLVVSVLVLSLVVSGTLAVYLWLQVRHTSQELQVQRPMLKITIDQYKNGGERMIDQFVVNLQEYGRTHPDFIPVLAKHGLKPGAAPSTNTAPAPAPAGKPPAK